VETDPASKTRGGEKKFELGGVVHGTDERNVIQRGGGGRGPEQRGGGDRVSPQLGERGYKRHSLPKRGVLLRAGRESKRKSSWGQSFLKDGKGISEAWGGDL